MAKSTGAAGCDASCHYYAVGKITGTVMMQLFKVLLAGMLMSAAIAQARAPLMLMSEGNYARSA